MSEPLIHISDVTRGYGGMRPLRLARFSISADDRVVLSGFDALAAESFVNLITGASLPETGEVFVAGRSTAAISTDTDWLTSLDRFGLVTDRAVLLDQMTVAANLALPLTLAIDPIPADVGTTVERLAADVGLTRDELERPASELGPARRMTLHLARALATGPMLVLLEHPTAKMEHVEDAVRFGAMLGALAARRPFGFVALSEDGAFAKASGGRQLRLNPATGRLAAPGLGGWLRRW